MSVLDSTSTLSEIYAAFLDNASYREDKSTAKAEGFITACNFLLLKRPTRIRQGEEEIEVDLALIEKQMDRAEAWIESYGDTGAGMSETVHVSFGDFRR